MTPQQDLLPGRWFICASNFPMWLSGKRRQPSITYGLLSASPLALTDLVQYKNKQGKTRSIKGTDTADAQGFTWRGNGPLKLLRSRWKVLYLAPNVLVIRFEKSLVTPAGVDVLARKETAMEELKQLVTSSPQTYNLAYADAKDLHWL